MPHFYPGAVPLGSPRAAAGKGRVAPQEAGAPRTAGMLSSVKVQDEYRDLTEVDPAPALWARRGLATGPGVMGPRFQLGGGLWFRGFLGGIGLDIAATKLFIRFESKP